VSLGGHNIPNSVIRRRFYTGLKNFFNLYAPIVSSWEIYDNSCLDDPVKIAQGGQDNSFVINDEKRYNTLRRRYDNGR
ncbi:MAG: zeta toxin, partial [Deltaproteobacteria bacterium]|nr:zeta toxin [Deltaproteobacteria bacterium]